MIFFIEKGCHSEFIFKKIEISKNKNPLIFTCYVYGIVTGYISWLTISQSIRGLVINPHPQVCYRLRQATSTGTSLANTNLFNILVIVLFYFVCVLAVQRIP